MTGKKKIFTAVTVIAVAATLVCALYIMSRGMGLSDSLDFGAGAYYYTDIPGYEKYVREDVYATSVPYWVHVVLFLCWGWLMYRLWCRVENSLEGKK